MTIGQASGWYRSRDWRLSANEAHAWAKRICNNGRYSAEACHLAQGVATIEVRSRRRPYPILHTLRTTAEAKALLDKLITGETPLAET